MAKKIGEAVLATILLAFLVGGFTVFISSSDNSIGITSYAQSELNGINNNITGNNQDLEIDFEQKVGNSTIGFEVVENTFIDKTGRDEASIMGTTQKRTLGIFINDAGRIMRLHPLITGLATSFVIILFGILLFRSILGESRW